MKLLPKILALQATCIYATYDDIKAQFLALAANTTSETRSFDSSWASSIIDSIDRYGCWCYFGDDHGKGHGPTQNEVDEACKILHDGYSCILLDAELDQDLDCVPWKVSYKSADGLGLNTDSGHNTDLISALQKSCQKKNKKSDCAERACIVEGYFVMTLFSYFLGGVDFNPELKHDLGIFDKSEECPRGAGPGGAGQGQKACCSEYPVRFPYRFKEGERQCCVNKIYNAVMLDCCDDGSVKPSCF